jgi:hypothetical protein
MRTGLLVLPVTAGLLMAATAVTTATGPGLPCGRAAPPARR